MKYQMFTIATAIFLTYALELPAKAITQPITDREDNNVVAQTAGRLNQGEQVLLKGNLSNSRGGLNSTTTSFPSVSPLDGRDLYQVEISSQPSTASVSFLLQGDPSTQLKVWADKNGDRKPDGDTPPLRSLPSPRSTSIVLAPGFYIVEVLKSTQLATPSAYSVEIKSTALPDRLTCLSSNNCLENLKPERRVIRVPQPVSK
jgi:hypothetical protein